MRIVTPLALCLLAGAAYAQSGPFLFDVLLKPSYRASWEKLMKEVQPTRYSKHCLRLNTMPPSV